MNEADDETASPNHAESRNSPPLRELPRDSGGQFASLGPTTGIRKSRTESQRKYMNRIKQVRIQIYEGFLTCFVLRGAQYDDIPSFRSRGALFELFSAFVQENYRLTPNLRYGALRNYVVNGIYLKWPNRALRSLGKYPLSYPGCRIPKTELVSEMRVVRNWLQYLSEKKALLHGSVDEAYGHAVRLLNSFWKPDSARAQLLLRDGGQNLDESGNSADGSVAALRERGVVMSACGSSTIGNRGRVSARDGDQGASNALDGNARGGGAGGVREEETVDVRVDGDVVPSGGRAKELIESAKDHDCYVMVHLVLVKGAEWEFGLFSGMILREWQEKGLTPTELMEAVLKFAYWKNNRILDESEHAERERKLQLTAKLMDKTRMAIVAAARSPDEKAMLRSELRLFHEMSWDFMVRGKED